MRYEVQAVDNLLQFDIHDDINIIQGENKADVFIITVSLDEDNLNLAEMSYTLKGNIGSYEVREVLSKVVTEDSVQLTWSPGTPWTITYGTLRLTLIATEDVDGEIIVAKWFAPEGLTIQKDAKGSNNVEDVDVAYQLLAQMQDLVANFDTSSLELYHNVDLLGRNDPDAHNIDAITGLREQLDSKTSVVLRSAPVGNLLTISADNEIVDSGHCCDDFATPEQVTELVQTLGTVDKNYIHRQSSASSVWHIHHTLNKMPNVTVVDSSGNVVIGDISYKDPNYITISFNGAFSGKCYLN